MRDWLRLAFSPVVVKQALIIAAVVGTILVLLNHGPALMSGEISRGRIAQIVLTVFVPYCVSTVSSVGAMRAAERDRPVRQP